MPSTQTLKLQNPMGENKKPFHVIIRDTRYRIGNVALHVLYSYLFLAFRFYSVLIRLESSIICVHGEFYEIFPSQASSLHEAGQKA